MVAKCDAIYFHCKMLNSTLNMTKIELSFMFSFIQGSHFYVWSSTEKPSNNL